jgi:hypothetical protein
MDNEQAKINARNLIDEIEKKTIPENIKEKIGKALSIEGDCLAINFNTALNNLYANDPEFREYSDALRGN